MCFPVNFVKYLRTIFYRTLVVGASVDLGFFLGQW